MSISLTELEWMHVGFALEDDIERKLNDKARFPLGRKEPIIKEAIKLFRKVDDHSYSLWEDRQ